MLGTQAFIITLVNDPESMKAATKCLKSIQDTKSNIIPFIFPAIDKDNALREADKRSLEYSYPTGVARMEQNLLLSPYATADINKRIGCFMSHFILWEMIAEQDPLNHYIILEQDAKFISSYDQEYFDDIMELDFICSLNTPIGATRKASLFDKMLKKEYETQNDFYVEVELEDDEEGGDEIEEEIYETEEIEEEADDEETELRHFPVPWIDEKQVPQGLPGNSAYIITPGAAKKLIQATYYLGIWPNDALMCKQIFPDMLYCAYPYYTKVQGNKSTTSL